MITDDERREVVARLRNLNTGKRPKYDDERLIAKWYGLICAAIGGKNDPWFGVVGLANRLAELIDPAVNSDKDGKKHEL